MPDPRQLAQPGSRWFCVGGERRLRYRGSARPECPLDWRTHNHRAEFVSVDANSVTHDGGDAAVMASTVRAFGAFIGRIRQRTSLPIWWSELHAREGGPGENREQTPASSRRSCVWRRERPWS